MSLIDPKNLDKKSGFEFHDLVRDGRSTDLDPIKVSAVLNALVESNNQMSQQLDEMTKLVLHMRNRSKPGPKPKRRKRSKLTPSNS